MNLKNILLREEARNRGMHTVSFHLYTILGKANYSERVHISDCLELGVKELTAWGHKVI